MTTAADAASTESNFHRVSSCKAIQFYGAGAIFVLFISVIINRILIVHAGEYGDIEFLTKDSWLWYADTISTTLPLSILVGGTSVPL